MEEKRADGRGDFDLDCEGSMYPSLTLASNGADEQMPATSYQPTFR